MSTDAPRGFSLLAWLQLCRAANVFTAMADIFAGYLLVRPNLGAGVPLAEVWDFQTFPARLTFGHDLWLLLGASSCLYLAGMVFNDIFDRHVDAVERPKRPIPSGRVRLHSAVLFGAVLVALGVILAGVASIPSLLVAMLLTGCIFGYDGGLKQTPVGPITMGLCRGFNILLGASTADAVAGQNPILVPFQMPQLHVALAMTVYIAGVTWFARQEATQSRRVPLALAAIVANLGLALLIAFVLHAPDPHNRSLYAALLLGAITVTIDRRIAAALMDPSPKFVQQAIRTMLLSLVMLNCAIVYFAQHDPLLAAIVAALLLPAVLLSRFLAVT